MSEAVRVGDLTNHAGQTLDGAGSPDVLIGNQKAWRAIPAGVGDGLEEASKMVKTIMDKVPMFSGPPECTQVVTKDLPQIMAKMLETAAKAEAAVGICGPQGMVQAAFMAFQPVAAAALATYTAASSTPAELGARQAFTQAFKAGLAGAMGASVTAIAGPGTWDVHNCKATIPMPPAHGPGLVTKGCKTVFINNLPAVMTGQQVFEAAGGPATIEVGCGTVIIGDIAPSPGGSPSSRKDTSQSGKKAAAAGGEARKESTKGNEPTDEPAADVPVKDKLWIRIDMKPEHAGLDEFVLTSTDGTYMSSKTVKDDKIPGNQSIDLMFENVDPSKSYTLRIHLGDERLTLFEDVPYDGIPGLQGEDQGSDDDAGDDGSGPLEQVCSSGPDLV